MQRGRIDCVIVGTDRTAANGDVANKIGTYTHAVLAHRHGVPFYVAAPTSSIDMACPNGEGIPIEERAGREITHLLDRPIAPGGVRVFNPAFDVTPSELVTAIVTERGVARRPFARTLFRLVARRREPAASANRSEGMRRRRR
jgi:methylthioribose-1-phosphate isomerase